MSGLGMKAGRIAVAVTAMGAALWTTGAPLQGQDVVVIRDKKKMKKMLLKLTKN